MFALHETTRRRVCRIAFMVLCVAPTLGVAAWIVRWYLPGRIEAEQARLSGQLFVDVRLADWSAPRPDTIRTTLLSLAQAPGNAQLLEVGRLESRRKGDVRWLTADQVTVDAAQLDELVPKLHEWLVALDANEFHVRCAGLVVTGGEAAISARYRDVECIVRRTAGGAYQAQILAPLETDNTDAQVLRMAVNGSPSPENGHGMILATLDATSASLPAWLLATGAPLGDGWGSSAAFSGTVRLEYAHGQLRGDAQGRLAPIDLETYASAISAHSARGHVDLQLDEFRWRGARIELAAGSLQAANVSVSRSVIAAAVRNLFCGYVAAVPIEAGNPGDLVPIDRIACRFAMDPEGLTLTGALSPGDNQLADCIATGGGRPLLTAPRLSPAHSRLHASAWLQFAAGPAPGWVPATREAVDAAQRLPLPSSGVRAVARRAVESGSSATD